MHGQARTVERKILLWIAQQERNRREEGALRLLDARGDAPVAGQRLGAPRPRVPSRISP
jgi:hypothetical protein